MGPGKSKDRDVKTLKILFQVYCRAHHPGTSLCADCSELETYALQRLASCRYQGQKPACSRCPQVCYKPSLRPEIQRVMKYAGPRILWSHPYLALRHLVQLMKKPVQG